MFEVHTFRARDGSGIGASIDGIGANLPGGPSAWVHERTLCPADMAAWHGVAGAGTGAEICAEVCRSGFFCARNRGAHFEPPPGETDL